MALYQIHGLQAIQRIIQSQFGVGYSQRKDAITTWPERRLPQTLFKSIMTDLNTYNPSATFKQPSSVVSATIEVGSNPLKLASEYTPAALRQTELFVNGTEPTAVSSEYEAVTIDAPFNVQANYNNVANLIDLSWSHSSTTSDDSQNVTYEVTMTIEGEAPTVISMSGATTVQIPNIQLGKNYTFSVVALSNNTRSEAASVSLYIEGEALEPEVIDPVPPNEGEGIIEEPNIDTGNPNDPGNGSGEGPGNNGNGNGNSNNNGNGNGNSNGNGNDNGTITPPTEPTQPNSVEEESTND